MRVEVPIFLFLAATGFHAVLAASLELAEKEDTFAEDGFSLFPVGLEQLSDLQKRDQEQFEAAQMNEDAHSEDVRYLEAVQDENTEENDTQEEDMDRDRDRDVEADEEESESDEEIDDELIEDKARDKVRTKPETKLRLSEPAGGIM
ncbi:cell division protein DivIB isoform X2 [Coregonus clupeaformis]|uniref:cell division protein DivIB isoform X2 n=1 Tax=Coregonus clupeaformis TaxID=59861 RepID=UPI001BE094E5|nr:cell division protein DivIB isoform X2 [Coregonus clupeaformis]